MPPSNEFGECKDRGFIGDGPESVISVESSKESCTADILLWLIIEELAVLFFNVGSVSALSVVGLSLLSVGVSVAVDSFIRWADTSGLALSWKLLGNFDSILP